MRFENTLNIIKQKVNKVNKCDEDVFNSQKIMIDIFGKYLSKTNIKLIESSSKFIGCIVEIDCGEDIIKISEDIFGDIKYDNFHVGNVNVIEYDNNKHKLIIGCYITKEK